MTLVGASRIHSIYRGTCALPMTRILSASAFRQVSCENRFGLDRGEIDSNKVVGTMAWAVWHVHWFIRYGCCASVDSPGFNVPHERDFIIRIPTSKT